MIISIGRTNNDNNLGLHYLKMPIISPISLYTKNGKCGFQLFFVVRHTHTLNGCWKLIHRVFKNLQVHIAKLWGALSFVLNEGFSFNSYPYSLVQWDIFVLSFIYYISLNTPKFTTCSV